MFIMTQRRRGVVVGLACAAMLLVATTPAVSADPVHPDVKSKNFTYTECLATSDVAGSHPHKDCVGQGVVAPTEVFATFKVSDRSLTYQDFEAYIFFDDEPCNVPGTYATIVGSNGTFKVLGSHQFMAAGRHDNIIVLLTPYGGVAPTYDVDCYRNNDANVIGGALDRINVKIR